MTNYQWQPDIIEDFKGINNQTDPFSDTASTELINFDIDTGGNLTKTLGYSRKQILDLVIDTVTIDATDTSIVTTTDHNLSDNDLIMLYDLVESTEAPTLKSIVGGMIYKVTVVDDNEFTIKSNTSGVLATLISGKVDCSLQELGNGFFIGDSTSLDTIKSYGSIRKNDVIYAFIGKYSSNFLCKFNLDSVDGKWIYCEPSPTEFATSDIAYFAEYDNKLVFTKNTKKSIGGQYGGVIYLNNNTLALFGVANNPTGKYLCVHNERLWVGNISYQSNTAVSGASWVIPSKIFPEVADTTVVVSGVAIGTTTKVTATGHTFVVGDRVYFNSIVGTVGTDLLNNNYWEITAINTDTFVLGDCNSTGLAYSSGGTAMLRGLTWGVSLYDNVGYGSGIIKCDNNTSDAVVQIASFKGYLNILRQKSIYIFTGSIETGDVTLPRALNVPYGAVSSGICITEGGIYFVSNYGLSQIVGVTVKSVKTEFDNIETLTVSEPIKIDILSRGDYSNIDVYRYDKYLWCYDRASKYVYQLDISSGNWNIHSNKQIDNLFRYTDYTYFIADTGIYQVGDGYYTYDDIHTKTVISSFWTSNIRVQGRYNVLKCYKDLYLLCLSKGNDSGLQLPVNVTYDNSKDKVQSFVLDLPINTVETWLSMSDNETLTWNEVSEGETLTWDEVLGIENYDMILKKYGLLTARSIKVEIIHAYPNDFTMNRMIIYYDPLQTQDIK